jgi:5'-3' exoribonuclease 2
LQLNGVDYVQVNTGRGGALHPSLPTRPQFDIVDKKLTKAERDAAAVKAGLANLEGSNEDVALNRRAIRMANLDAAARLKAELMGLPMPEPTETDDETKEGTKVESEAKEIEAEIKADETLEESREDETPLESEAPSRMSPSLDQRGIKRTADEADLEDKPTEEAAPEAAPLKKLKFNPDGTVDGYVDDVRLWEPGYRERYYEQKYGVQVTDTAFINE